MSKTVTDDKQSLEQRRQEALAVAQQCIKLLQQDFGATEVILFGSLAGDGPWHWRSDLDLAVRGMSEDAIRSAYSALEKIAPGWLKIDLVPLLQINLNKARQLYPYLERDINQFFEAL